jgi:hypothetical protein
MRPRLFLVVMVASLCLNVAFVGAYLVHMARHDRPRRFPARRLAPDVREKLRQTRADAAPGFAALADEVESADSLLWAEMRIGTPDSVQVDSLCRELGRIHGAMRAMVFRQMHRELQLMPAAAREEYLQQMMKMRPGLGRPGRRLGARMRHDPRKLHHDEPFPQEVPPGPPPESGD